MNNTSYNFNFMYDQIVSFGEITSSKIPSTYLNSYGIINTWIDISNFIKTDSNYREGNVDWEYKKKQFENFDISKTYVTLEFITSNSNNLTVTLGREGTDYSTAIITYYLKSEEVTVCKDVTGIMTGDPAYFNQPKLIESLSYEYVMKMKLYGASVIHPKTIFILQKNEIPLTIRSFLYSVKQGTTIKNWIKLDLYVSCIIQKLNVHLLTISFLAFSYKLEDNLYVIFKQLSELYVRISIIKISAFSVSLVFEDKFNSINILLNTLTKSFNVTLKDNVCLRTAEIRNNFRKGKTILL